MTLEREGVRGPFVVQCDECMEVMELDCFEFAGALAKLKSRGWVPTYNADEEEWNHLCKDCQEDCVP
jgi:hypothetical protein